MSIGAVFMFRQSLMASSAEVAVDVSEEDESVLHLQGGAQSEIHTLQRFECTYDVRSQKAVEIADDVGSDVVEDRAAESIGFSSESTPTPESVF